MSSNTCSTPMEAVNRLTAMREERAALLAEATHSFSHAELMDILAEDERCRWAAPSALHPILNRLVAEATPSELGGSTMIDALVQRLLISRAEASRRIRDAAVLGPRRGLTGEKLSPLWAATAEGQSAGEIGPEQLVIIRKFMKKVPSWVDHQTCEEAERSLAAIARQHAPADVQAAADLLLLCLNPDGEYSENDRQFKRWIRIGKQDADGMSKISGYITPELRALFEAVLAVWARYGKCNPDDPETTPPPELPDLADVLADFATAHADAYPPPDEADPAADIASQADTTDTAAGSEALSDHAGPTAEPGPTPEAESESEDLLGKALATPVDPGPTPTAHELADHDAAIADTSPYRDTRNQGQRNHDAVLEILRKALSCDFLPKTRGAPTTVVITMSAQQLLDGAGHVVTATGSWLPFSDAIRMAVPSHPVLVVFDDHTGKPLYLGRGKRIATYDQWLALFALQRGCCRPGCTVAAAHCEIHHHREWAQEGRTDIDQLSLECTCDHRLLSLGYTTALRADGRVEWTPPAHLDIGQPRVNDYFFPENLLRDAEKQLTQHNENGSGTG